MTSQVTSYQAFRRTKGELPLTIEQVTEELPKSLGLTEVLIRIHAVSLNFRDVGMLHGKYPREVLERGIATSDCAAEVVDVGAEVTDFKIGDHVAPIFDLTNLTGEETGESIALGGEAEGVLRQYAVYDQQVLVHLPTHLTWEEASTIACAGVTAWNSLNMPATANKNKHALLEGTGGVSMFALVICLAAGITPIITSSSDAKAAAIQKLGPEGAIKTINYKTHADWEVEAQKISQGGVDIVINNAGPPTFEKSLASLRRRGQISLVGFLEGFTASIEPTTLIGILGKSARVQGITVGSKVDFQNLNKFLEEKKVRLDVLIDRTFAFEESKEAFDYLFSGKHVGKVVIKL